MNAGIVILQDGTPCIVYDEPLATAVKAVEFSYEDHLITLVYDPASPPVSLLRQPKKEPVVKGSKIALMKKVVPHRHKLEYPLDQEFVGILKDRKNVAIGLVKEGKLADIRMIPISFTKA